MPGRYTAVLALAATALGCSGEHMATPQRDAGPALESPDHEDVAGELTTIGVTKALGAFQRDAAGVGFVNPALRVRLPDNAREFVALGSDSGAALSFRPLTTGNANLKLVNGDAVYRDASGQGRHVIVRAGLDRVEDFLRLASSTDPSHLDYEIDLRGLQSARQLQPGGTLEFLDAEGAPRFRAQDAAVVDSAGKRRAATLELRGCAVDHDPRAPWGRSHTPLGAATCQLRVSFDASGLSYPLWVDPVWSSTGSLSKSVAQPVAVKLQDNRVLLGEAGGTFAAYFDPNTGTWADAPVAPASIGASAALLSSGAALFVGGTTTGSSVRFDPSVGAWSSAAFAQAPAAPLVALANGNAVFVASSGTSVRVSTFLETTTGTWALGPTAGVDRTEHAAALMPDGKVLIAGGYDDPSPVPSCYVFDPATSLVTPTDFLPSSGRNSRLLPLSNGTLLYTGGEQQQPFAAIYQPSSGQWQSRAMPPVTTGTHALTSFGPSALLTGIAAGGTGAIPNRQSYLFDVLQNQWSRIGDMTVERTQHAAVELSNGRVLLAAGKDTSAKLASAELLAYQVNGGACSLGSDCQSGKCVDGVCCDNACTAPCQACSAAAKGGGNDGVCGFVIAGSDPDNECATQAAITCGADGSCNGAGACSLYPAGTNCGNGVCNGASSLSPGGQCDGNGGCVPQAPMICPNGCQSGACVTSCTNPNDCPAGFRCDTAQSRCVGDTAQGSSCDSDAQCVTGHCADGVCCDTACDGGCSACVASQKGFGNDGVCEPVAAGLDPRDACSAQSPPCGPDGACDGIGNCRSSARLGTKCGATVCQGGLVSEHLCDGLGECKTLQDIPCAPFNCNGDACGTSCVNDNDCAQGARCFNSVCIGRSVVGTGCAGPGECTSDVCRDGYCCDDSCNGKCEACDASGSPGRCSLVSGDPHGERGSCGGEGVCAGTCNGNTPACYFPVAESCGAGKTCSANGSCVQTSSACLPNDVSLRPDGIEIPCAPFACNASSGVCRDRCASSTDCASGNVCNADNGSCVRAAAPPAEDDGCGCTVPANSGKKGGLWFALLALALLRTRLARSKRDAD